MANNLFISYDLYKTGQDYEKVETAIKSLGNWAKLQLSHWYVKSNFSAQQAADHIWKSMDGNDKLLVVDATNNTAYWYNLNKEVSDHLVQQWNK